MNTQVFFSLRFLRQARHTSIRLFFIIPALFSILLFIQTSFAAAVIDTVFNASVTEGFGTVQSTVVQPDGKIIAVGFFSRANGARFNGIARFNADGSLDSTFNPGSGTTTFIRAVALQPDGKILIAGSFTVFNGVTVRRIVRLNSDGGIDSSFSTVPNFNNQINDVVVQPDGKILVAGHFSQPAANFVRLNADGTMDIAFSPVNTAAHKIAYLASGKVLLGGDPGSNGAIRRFNADGTADATFTPGTGPSSTVFEIVLQADGKILLGGAFTSFNGTATDGMVRLNDNGTFDTAFDYLPPNSDNLEVHAIAVQQDQKIFETYYYLDATGFHSRVVRFNSNGTLDGTFTAGDAEDFPIFDMKFLADGKLLVGGAFVAYNNQTHVRLARLNTDGTVDITFNPAASSAGSVNAIKRQSDGKIVIGGDFEFVNGVRKSAFARLNADGTLDNTFNIPDRIFGDLFAMLIQPDGKILVAGSFYINNAPSTYNIARYNTDGSLDATFDFDSMVVAPLFIFALALQPDGKIVAGGNILNFPSTTPHTCMRLNSNGSVDPTFTMFPLNVAGTTRAIAIQADGKIVIGGTFSSVNSVTRHGIARLNSDGTLDGTGFNLSTVSFQYFSLAQQADGKIVGGGNVLRRFNGNDGSIDGTFFAMASVGGGLIRAIELQPDGKIILGGAFVAINGAIAPRIARINSDGTRDPAFGAGTGASAQILALALQPDNKIVAGGQFLDYNSTEKLSIVRIQNVNVPAPFDFDGDGKTDLSIFRPSVGEWWYLKSSDGGNAAAQFGAGTDTITPGDFTGDGKADIAFWRPSTGFWFILRSEDFSFYSFPFGTTGDVPAPGDFDGDGKADATIFRPSTATWYIFRSSDNGTTIQQFGQNGDAPVVSDYDGDGKADIAIYRVALGEWWIQRSAAGTIAFQFGNSSDKPVQGDFTGDGRSDVAIWRPSTGEWFILRSENQSYYSFPFGTNGDSPAPGDYDGDGKFDASIFRPSSSTWYVQRTTAGTLIQTFGIAGDRAVPNAFVP